MWKWIKVPKGIALLSFALPWLTVSCGSQKFITASGYNLATGTTRFVNPMTDAVQTQGGSVNAWLLIALILVVLGFGATFIARRTGALAVLATSAAAFVLVWIGTASIEGNFSREVVKAAKRSNGGAPSPFGEPDMSKMAALIRFDWEFGYWLCMIALLVTAIVAWLVYSGREAAAIERLRGAMPSASASDPVAAEPVASVNCPACGRNFPASTRFCPDDGTALG